MSSSPPTTTEERRRKVFLAARAVFTGQKAFIRDRNTVEKFITRHERSFRKDLLNLDKQPVIDMTLSLLRKQVFESEEKAKLVFPELYHVSPVRGLQHDTSEKNAARSEAEALKEISRSEDVLYGVDDADDLHRHLAGTPIAEESPNHGELTSPSIFPAYLSYAVQHKLLNTVQRLLEECCYDFAANWVPHLVADHKWDCAEAVEIGRWSEVLPSQYHQLSALATSLESSEDLGEALRATHPLRHAAVHRLRTSCKGVERMLNRALYLVRVLHDDTRSSRLETLLEDFRARRQDLETTKNSLENQLDQKLQDIQEQRAALDREEEEAKENMVKQDRDSTKSISSLFEKSIANLTLDWSRHGDLNEADTSALEHDQQDGNGVDLIEEDCHKAEPAMSILGDEENNACSEMEPTYSGCDEADSGTVMQNDNHEAEPGVLRDDYTSYEDVKNIYRRRYEAVADIPKQSEYADNDLWPEQSNDDEAESGAVKYRKTAASDIGSDGDIEYNTKGDAPAMEALDMSLSSPEDDE